MPRPPKDDAAPHHRSGKLKQQNKSHKSAVRSKRDAHKMLVSDRPRGSSVASNASTGSTSGNRKQRRSSMDEARKKHKSDLGGKKRMGGRGVAPRMVCVVELGEVQETTLVDYARSVASSSYAHFNDEMETHCFQDKTKFTFFKSKEVVGVLDACKAADLVVFCLKVSGAGEDVKSVVSSAGLAGLLANAVDERGREIVSAMKAQGMPTSIGVIQGLEDVPAKHRNAAKRNSTTFLQEELGAIKVVELDKSGDRFEDCAKSLMRALSEVHIKNIVWRSERPYLLATEAKVEGANGILSGYLRGRPLSMNQLIHVTGKGSFRVLRIRFPEDPYQRARPAAALAKAAKMELDDEFKIEDLVPDMSIALSLKEEAEPDLMTGEQTWPTKEEMGDIDEGDEDEDAMSENGGGSGKGSKKSSKTVDAGKEYLNAWGVDDMNEDGTSQHPDDEFDFGPDLLNKKPKTKSERAKMDLDFPDEMDTPHDVTARIRFAKYRGLKSFRTSPWNPNEALPREYAYIHRIKDYKQAQKIVLTESEKVEQAWIQDADFLPADFVAPGTFVELVLENFASSLQEISLPIVATGLLSHEQKLSVLNCLMQPRFTTAPVESREELELHVGPWRRLVRPVFSEHNLNSDKHKMERFLEQNRWSMCTVFGPIVFGTNVPALLFRPKTGELVASGSVHNVDPNRIVLKKTVLTGHPLRVKKRWSVVRKMFFNPDDVAWFQPIELYTKYGASGRILEPVGTHGSMKCLFDRVITQQDTICMSLYKRVFPKGTMGMFQELRDQDGDDFDKSDSEVGGDDDDNDDDNDDE